MQPAERMIMTKAKPVVVDSKPVAAYYCPPSGRLAAVTGHLRACRPLRRTPHGQPAAAARGGVVTPSPSPSRSASQQQQENRDGLVSGRRWDVVVVGAGAWGIAMLKLLCERGYTAVCIERGGVCANLRSYMRRMAMHYPTPYMALDSEDALLGQGSDYHPEVEELADHYARFATKHALPICTGTTLLRVDGSAGNFRLTVASSGGSTGNASARHVVLATGRYDSPTLMGVEGEDADNVHHYLAEWQHIKGQRLLFVGGGFSSADGVSRLGRENTIVWVTRKSKGDIDAMLVDQRTKWGMFDADPGSMEVWAESEVVSLAGSVATVRGKFGGGDVENEWAFDQCFLLTGHGPDPAMVTQVLLGDCAHDAEFQSVKRPGISIVGALSPSHYHLGHIGLLDSPVFNAPELLSADKDDQHMALKACEAIAREIGRPSRNGN